MGQLKEWLEEIPNDYIVMLDDGVDILRVDNITVLDGSIIIE